MSIYNYLIIGLLLLILAALSLLVFLMYREQQRQSQLRHYVRLLLSQALGSNKQLQSMDKNLLLGMEKNRSDTQLFIEKALAETLEKINQQAATIHLNTINTINQHNQQQLQQQQQAARNQSESLENALKRHTDSQHRLFSDLRQTTEQHLGHINERVEARLKQGFEQTNQIFSDIRERLSQIDHAQQKISELSGHVISLQQTLDNKGARGAFGEVQLMDIVKDMMPDKYCQFQQPLSNGKRPDCTILLPQSSGKLVIDAKFPLENYQRMQDGDLGAEQQHAARRQFAQDIKKHINDIAQKYIIPGETTQGAVMFIPSEAVFAQIQAHHPQLVQHARLHQVWMTSPTTLMAVLTTARAVLADEERSRQAQIIHHHLNALGVEFNRFSQRMDDLARHIQKANEDVNKIHISSKKISSRFSRIEQTDFEQLDHPEKQVPV